MLSYFNEFFDEFNYPLDSRETFISTYKAITTNEYANSAFEKFIKEYSENVSCDYLAMLTECENIAKELIA